MFVYIAVGVLVLAAALRKLNAYLKNKKLQEILELEEKVEPTLESVAQPKN